jgi:hypothetical protein
MILFYHFWTFSEFEPLTEPRLEYARQDEQNMAFEFKVTFRVPLERIVYVRI